MNTARSQKLEAALAVKLVLAVAALVALPLSGAHAVVAPGANALVAAHTNAGVVAIDPATGNVSALLGSVAGDFFPSVFPSASKVVVFNIDVQELFVMDFPSGVNRQQLTTTGGTVTFGRGGVSPDNSRVVYSTSAGLFTVPATGPFPQAGTMVLGSQPNDSNPDYSRDGQFIVFDDDSASGIYRVNADNSGGRTGPLLGTGADDVFPSVSPDGSRVYYQNGAAGIASVPFPDGGGETPLNGTVANDFGPWPSPDGTLVAFAAPGAGIFTVNADDTGGRAELPGGADAFFPSWAATQVTPDPDGNVAPAFTSCPAAVSAPVIGPETSYTVAASGSPTPSLTGNGPFTFSDNGDGTAFLSFSPSVIDWMTGFFESPSQTVTASNVAGSATCTTAVDVVLLAL